MYSSSIEDIMIDKDFNKKNKKGKPILVILVILIILLILAGVAYWYITIFKKDSNKTVFLKSIANTKIDFFLDNETHQAIAEKFINNSFEMENNVKFSTSFEEYADTDFSKFLVNWTTINDNENNENSNDIKITYADNDLIDFKLINTEKQFAIKSDELIDKYIGINKENLKDFANRIDSTGTLENIITSAEKNIPENKAGISEEERQAKIKEYITFLEEQIGEEKVTTENNYLLEKSSSSENVEVTPYKLSLTQEELNNIVKEFLTKIKNDDDLIKKVVTGSKKSLEDDENNSNTINENSIQVEKRNTTDDSENESDNSSELNVQPTTSLTPIGTALNIENTEEQNEEVSSNSEESNLAESSNNLEEEDLSETSSNSNESDIALINNTDELKAVVDSEEELESEDGILIKFFINFLLGTKMDATEKEIQTAIDDYIKKLPKEGEGLTITTYVSEAGTEKISAVLPNSETVDMEFSSKSESERDVTITYLYEKETINYDENDVATYSATDNTLTDELSVNKKQKNGIKLEIHKNKNDSNTTIKTVCNLIKNEKIEEKYTINLVTKGTENSKNINNDISVTYSNNEGEFKVSLENKIQFEKKSDIEKLTEENCLFLDKLSDEELENTITEISTKALQVYSEKIKNLDFIDTNTQAPAITQNNTKNREEAKDALITTVGNQMGEAQARGEEYTIANLEGLQIENHEVTVNIENDIAHVVVDGVKFTIDSNFQWAYEE